MALLIHAIDGFDEGMLIRLPRLNAPELDHPPRTPTQKALRDELQAKVALLTNWATTSSRSAGLRDSLRSHSWRYILERSRVGLFQDRHNLLLDELRLAHRNLLVSMAIVPEHSPLKIA